MRDDCPTVSYCFLFVTDYYSEMRDGCRYGMLLREVHEVVAWVEDRQRRMDLLRSYHKAGWLTDVQWICAIEVRLMPYRKLCLISYPFREFSSTYKKTLENVLLQTLNHISRREYRLVLI